MRSPTILQVIQFLLAKNYYMTALELLVESQQAGRLDEVAELLLFFGDTDKFPPEELAKHQSANGQCVSLAGGTESLP